MASANYDSLHLLSIDLGSAPPSLRATLERGLGLTDLRQWLSHAAEHGAPLVVVRSGGCVDLYSTHLGRHVAFKPLLTKLRALSRDFTAVGLVRTTEATGSEVARHLLRMAAGLDATESGRTDADGIELAAAYAHSAGSVTPVLQSLFELATTTRNRSLLETELEAPTSTRASRHIDALGAERIVEEELTAFKAGQVEESMRPSVSAPRPSTPSLFPFSSQEPGSFVRVKVAITELEERDQRRLG